jgi:RNA polymerase subunit RPABC4/transcription elongation factor Spt4
MKMESGAIVDTIFEFINQNGSQIILAIALLLGILWVVVVWSIWLDVARRYKNIFVQILMVLIGAIPIIGAIIYVLIRPQKNNDESFYIELEKKLLLAEATDIIECPNCARVLNTSFNVCPTCGTSLIKECKKCGENLYLDYRYCSNCGEMVKSKKSKSSKVTKKKKKKKGKKDTQESVALREALKLGIDWSEVKKSVNKKLKTIMDFFKDIASETKELYMDILKKVSKSKD